MAMKTEMKVLPYIKRSVQDKDGQLPLMGRIAVRGKNNSIAQFSCKFKVDVKLWNATVQRCTGKSRMAVMANREIERTLLLLLHFYQFHISPNTRCEIRVIKWVIVEKCLRCNFRK